MSSANYIAPDFIEIRMDAEIGSYQEADAPREPDRGREYNVANETKESNAIVSDQSIAQSR